MSVRKATFFFSIFALTVSVGCIRLGFWQVSRLGERRAANALVVARLAEPPVPLAALSGDTALRFRRARATGTYDYPNEFVLTSRSRNGSPGVHVITPLRVPGNDSAILVNRGWVYAPDGMKIDLTLYHEDSAATEVDGFVERFAVAQGPVSTPSVERAVRRLDRDSIVGRLPYPIASVILVQQKDSGEFAAVDRGTPVRVEPPPLDEGSHKAYAIQWFGFALVGIAGTILVLQRDRARRAEPGTNP